MANESSELSFVFIFHFLRVAFSLLGDVAHSAVIKWEKFQDEPTNMNWACEKDIRMFVITHLDPSYLSVLYKKLENVAVAKATKIKLEAEEILAA